MARLNLGEVIAIRRLSTVGNGARRVIVRVGRPRRVRAGEWACPVELTGLADTNQIAGRGVDSCQALVDALQGVHHTLQRSGLRLSWLGLADQTGFPLAVPYGLGPQLEAKIIKHIERELARFVGVAKRRQSARTSR